MSPTTLIRQYDGPAPAVKHEQGKVVARFPSQIKVIEQYPRRYACLQCAFTRDHHDFRQESAYMMLWHVHAHLFNGHLHAGAVSKFTALILPVLKDELLESAQEARRRRASIVGAA